MILPMGLFLVVGVLAVAVAGLLVAAFLALWLHDRYVSKDNILRNYPVFGRVRQMFIEMGPKLRQYIIADNNEELPFNRDERDWIYRSADGENNYFGFGTDDQLLSIGYPIIKHAVFPYGEASFAGAAHDPMHELPSARTLGEHHGRPKAWQPPS